MRRFCRGPDGVGQLLSLSFPRPVVGGKKAFREVLQCLALLLQNLAQFCRISNEDGALELSPVKLRTYFYRACYNIFFEVRDAEITNISDKNRISAMSQIVSCVCAARLWRTPTF